MPRSYFILFCIFFLLLLLRVYSVQLESDIFRRRSNFLGVVWKSLIKVDTLTTRMCVLEFVSLPPFLPENSIERFTPFAVSINNNSVCGGVRYIALNVFSASSTPVGKAFFFAFGSLLCLSAFLLLASFVYCDRRCLRAFVLSKLPHIYLFLLLSSLALSFYPGDSWNLNNVWACFRFSSVGASPVKRGVA